MKIDNEVLAVLSRAQLGLNSVVLTGQLERKLYERTNKVLEAAGGKWDRKQKAHVFAEDATTRIEQILLTGDIVIPKDEFEFFPTPPTVVARVMDLADIQDGHLVLEPSAGRGALATAAHACGIKVMVDMYELMPENHQFLQKLNLPLSGVVCADFLLTTSRPVYDRVVMNPPFGRQADIKHVTHAFKFLKPGGLLVAIMSAGVMFRENRMTTEFRAMVDHCGGTIEPLAEGSFKASGTGVNTVIVVIPA